ncbi:MAG: type I restriction enzyme HsdR N-terminal domain-containing protein [Desulfobacteraceae bacterium]|nr:type I restriction enzyme HsdR N-terminal domain-containing protein [Desulfobacteraceae bacterium]
MAKLPKKVIERLTKTVSKFQRVLKVAKDRDVNEADTVLIVGDILSEVFGFDKFMEVTCEFAIRNTYCDLAIKINGKIQYLLEVKAIGLDLKENYLKQVVNYGANQGVQWVVLTNGINWEIYNIRFEKPINHDLVCALDLLEINPKKVDDQEKLYLLCKEGLGKSVREDYHERMQSVNRFVIGALIQSDDIINVIKRELRKLSSGLKVENSEIEKILQNEVLKREVLEGEAAKKATQRIKRAASKSNKKPKVTKPATSPQQPVPASSFSEQLLQETKKI